MRRTKVILVSLLLFVFMAFVFTACGTEKKPPTVGETKTFNDVCDKANEGKRVALEGYLRLPEEVKMKTGAVLRLYPTLEFSGKPVGVSVVVGNQPNEIHYIPKEYTDKDLKVNLADGHVADFGTKVKVSGDAYYPLVGQDFQCALENPLIELAK